MGILLHILHFRVGKGGLAGGAPVDDARAAVDEALFVEAHEGLAHGAAEALVHGEALARPVAGDAQFAQLADDAATVFFFPRPGAFEELFAADHLLGDALGLQRLDHLDLGGDGGVVRARHPEGRVALHAVVADEHILRHLIQRVAHVELAGDVRRRHDDGEGLLFRVDDRLEGPGRLPLFVDARFHILRRKYLVHLEFLHGLPSVRYKKPVPAKGRGQTAVPPLFAPCGASLRCTGRAPADYFPSPARLGSDLRASAIQAALQPVDRPLLGACALLLSVTGKYDYSKFGRRSQAKFAAGMVKPWRRAGKSRPRGGRTARRE